VLGSLEVNPKKMRENLALTNGLISSEAVMLQLARRIGRQSAHELVHELAMRSLREGLSFRECLLGHPEVRSCLTEAELDRLLDPASYVGLAALFVDQVCSLAAEDGLS
jgi:adenylosuccinate lyase